MADAVLLSRELSREPHPASREGELGAQILEPAAGGRDRLDLLLNLSASMASALDAAALTQTGGKVAGAHGAAALLGMKPTTLYSRILALGLRRSVAGVGGADGDPLPLSGKPNPWPLVARQNQPGS